MRRAARRLRTACSRRLLSVALVAFALIVVGCTSDAADDGGASDVADETAARETAADETAASSDLRPCDAEPTVLTTDDGVDFVRTPDACFDDLPGWSYAPQYVEIDGLRQAYVDEGPADGDVVLLLHGQPSWSYLYRDMIPVFADAGYRVIAMDHLGMGRSDKPTAIESYTYLGHGDRLEAFIADLGLTDINLFVQDWGSLIGLRIAGENPDLFASITVGNGNLPVIPAGTEPFPPVANPDVVVTDLEPTFGSIPDQQVPVYDGCELINPPPAGEFADWMVYAMTAESFTAGEVVEALTWFDLTPEEEAAYDAPFPSRTYMAGPRTFPSLVNQLGGTTEDAWAGLQSYDRPFLTLWAANDRGSLGSCETQQRLVASVPGAVGQPHDRLPEASHFLQSDQGTEIADRMVDWMAGFGSVGATLADGATNDHVAVGDGFLVTNQLGPSTEEQFAEFQQPGPDGPIYMVNLLEFKEFA
ncbi:MAG: haloalkane dehalogenase, partial [Actinomycetota bacterium]